MPPASRSGARPRRRARRYDVAFYLPLIGSLLAPGSSPPPGGAESQVYLLARALAQRGFRVCVVAYEIPEGLPDAVEGIDIVPRPPPRWKAIRGPAGKVAEIVAVWNVVGRLRAEVFVQRATSMEVGLVALAAKARRRRFVYSSASLIDFDWGSVATRRNVALYELGVRLADAIVVQTAEQVEACRRRFGREPVMIKSIAEPAESRTAPPEAFLWAGKLASYKRPLAFVELARAVPEARFRMIGVPSEKDSAQVAAELERAAVGVDNLELLPPRPRSELAKLIDGAAAVVGTGDYEGMSNVFLEGWARGVPTLSLTHDPDGLIAREGLGGFASGSPERLAELARQLWHSRADQRALAERCRDYVEREHGLESVVDRWADVLGLRPESHP